MTKMPTAATGGGDCVCRETACKVTVTGDSGTRCPGAAR